MGVRRPRPRRPGPRGPRLRKATAGKHIGLIKRERKPPIEPRNPTYAPDRDPRGGIGY